MCLCMQNLPHTLKYRINGGGEGVGIIGGLEMVRHNNNRGGWNNRGAAWRNRKQPFS